MSRNFANSTDIIKHGTSTAFDNQAAMTFCAWINPSNLNSDEEGVILKVKNSTFAGSQLTVGDLFAGASTNSYWFFVAHATTHAESHGAIGSITIGSWKFIAGTFIDGGGAPKLYQGTTPEDLVEATYSVQIAPVGARDDDSVGGPTVGGRWNGSAVDIPFPGKIQYPAIFNRVLTLAELKVVMEFPLNIKNGLLLMPRYGSASPERDLSGNGNDGTVTGATVSADEPPMAGVFVQPPNRRLRPRIFAPGLRR